MSRDHLYRGLVILCVALPLVLTGCNTTGDYSQGAGSFPLSGDEARKQLMQKPFVIGVDDIVSVYVRNNPEITGDFTVGAEGTIFLPLLGEVQAAGLTKPGLQKSLTDKLSKFIIQPEVSVGISQYRSKKVYVIGEVSRPGPVPVKGNLLTVWDAINEAGLPLKTAALWRVHVISPDLEKPVVRRINLRKIMYGGKFAQNIFLKPDDIVVVPSTLAVSLGAYLGQIVAPANASRRMAEVYEFFKNKSYFLDTEYGRFGRIR